MVRKSLCFGFAILLAHAQAAAAGPQQCGDAVDQYNSAASEVSDALRLYASCLSSSEGRDDCSSEFASLTSAQSDFESAVSNYQSECG